MNLLNRSLDSTSEILHNKYQSFILIVQMLDFYFHLVHSGTLDILFVLSDDLLLIGDDRLQLLYLGLQTDDQSIVLPLYPIFP